MNQYCRYHGLDRAWLAVAATTDGVCRRCVVCAALCAAGAGDWRFHFLTSLDPAQDHDPAHLGGIPHIHPALSRYVHALVWFCSVSVFHCCHWTGSSKAGVGTAQVIKSWGAGRF